MIVKMWALPIIRLGWYWLLIKIDILQFIFNSIFCNFPSSESAFVSVAWKLLCRVVLSWLISCHRKDLPKIFSQHWFILPWEQWASPSDRTVQSECWSSINQWSRTNKKRLSTLYWWFRGTKSIWLTHPEGVFFNLWGTTVQHHYPPTAILSSHFSLLAKIFFRRKIIIIIIKLICSPCKLMPYAKRTPSQEVAV